MGFEPETFIEELISQMSEELEIFNAKNSWLTAELYPGLLKTILQSNFLYSQWLIAQMVDQVTADLRVHGSSPTKV